MDVSVFRTTVYNVLCYMVLLTEVVPVVNSDIRCVVFSWQAMIRVWTYY